MESHSTGRVMFDETTPNPKMEGLISPVSNNNFSKKIQPTPTPTPKQDIDQNLLNAIAQVESGGDPQAVSPAGAQGKFQFTPQTVQELARLGFNNGKPIDPFNPQEAEEGAKFYMDHLLNRFKNLELAIAAYNAGPGNVEKYNGIPPFPETQNYVKKIKERIQ